MHSIYGLDVHVSQDRQKRKLPDEVIPGVVPWPPGFKEEMDAWMLSFFGVTNLVKDGDVIRMGRAIYMNPRTVERLKAATGATK
jgi:hypothetical protein